MKKVAIITGAGRGIGRACALALAKRNWKVVINYRANSEAAKKTAALIKKSGGVCLTLKADINFDINRKKLIEETISNFGRLDLLVNNAGIAPRQRSDILEATETSYDEVMSTNLKAPFFLTQLSANKMIELKKAKKIVSPKIINISSISAYTSSLNRGEYCLSKAGLSMMTKLFAHRLAEFGINVFEIRPGIIKTDMTKNVREKYDLLIKEGFTPIQRWGEPEDVARAVVAIAEDCLPFSTGEVINVDGGFHLRRL